MRRLALVVAVLLALVVSADAGQWLTGSATNPITDQIIVTTAALSAQHTDLVVYVRSTVAVTLALERLSGGAAAANDSVQFLLAAGASPFMVPLTFDFKAGDTFQVRVVNGVTGTVQGAIRVNDYCLQGLGCAR